MDSNDHEDGRRRRKRLKFTRIGERLRKMIRIRRLVMRIV